MQEKVQTPAQSIVEGSVHEFPSSMALDYAADVLALYGHVPPSGPLIVKAVIQSADDRCGMAAKAIEYGRR